MDDVRPLIDGIRVGILAAGLLPVFYNNGRRK